MVPPQKKKKHLFAYVTDIYSVFLHILGPFLVAVFWGGAMYVLCNIYIHIYIYVVVFIYI